ncbi:MAG: TolC family protein [Bacteroidales bacterium]|nr:TolC family protein [Bacteroidales bacterium]
MRKLHLLTAILFILLNLQNLSAQSNNSMTLTIDEMFKLASKNSKQLKLLNSDIKTSEKTTEVAQNSLLPTLGISLSASYLGNGIITDRDFTNATAASMPHFGNNFAMEASQTIFAGGAISNNIAKARLGEQIARLNYDQGQMNVRFLLVGYYLDLYKLRNQRKVYIKNKEQTNLLIDQIKAKQQEGMALGNDITRHELMLQNIELAIMEIDNNCKILNNQLVTTLGLPDSVMIIPDTSILTLDLINTTQTDLMHLAEQNLPEIKTADMNIRIAETTIRIAKAEYLPSLILVAADYLNGPITIEIPPINNNYNYWYAGIGLKYNLSSLYTAKHGVNLAKARQNSANDAKSVIEEKSMLAVQSAYIKYREAFDKLHTFEKSDVLAKENYQVINNRYINNMVLITEMLDASNSKLDAELQVVYAKINIIFNYYNLKYLSGTL